MAISQPGGRIGHPTTDTPGREKASRSDKGYQDGVKVGFGLKTQSLDGLPVSPKAPVKVGKESMPSVDMTPAIGNVNKNEK